MDAVSRILEERERARSGFARWVVLATALHLTLAASVFALTRLAPGRPHRLPSVAVRLVTLPAPRPGPPASGPEPAQPAPKPAPPPKPRPAAAPAPTAPPPRRQPPEKRPSDTALAAPGAHATPVPEATPAPGGGAAGGPAGLSLGSGGGEQIGIPSDFRFTYYVQRMLGLIESHWFKPPAPPDTRTRVRFTIGRNGQLTGIALEEGSGVPAFDRAALRAMYATNPLPPLPFGYEGESLTVHLTFSETP